MVLKRYPILADLPQRPSSLAIRFGVRRSEDVFALFIMGLEARAMTGAMINLKRLGVLALPAHDSLIVPQSTGSIAAEALTQTFQSQLGKHVASARVGSGFCVTPRLKVVGKPDAVPAQEPLSTLPAKEYTPEDPEGGCYRKRCDRHVGASTICAGSHRAELNHRAACSAGPNLRAKSW